MGSIFGFFLSIFGLTPYDLRCGQSGPILNFKATYWPVKCQICRFTSTCNSKNVNFPYLKVFWGEGTIFGQLLVLHHMTCHAVNRYIAGILWSHIDHRFAILANLEAFVTQQFQFLFIFKHFWYNVQ